MWSGGTSIPMWKVELQYLATPTVPAFSGRINVV
jgi:hypothetical protein